MKGTLSPVILLGMHRSGTSLLSRMLSDLGLFVGQDLQDDHESVFFIRCNDWILRQGLATWDHPEIFLKHSKNPAWLKKIAIQLREKLHSSQSSRYAGPVLSATFRENLAFDFPWGWKDPRNNFTLPVWLELYPEARVIHIARHGVDVSRSLVTRERRLRQKLVTLAKASMILWPRSDTDHFVKPWRCVSLEGAFTLWEAYMRESRIWVRTLGDRAREIIYEDFLQEPAPVLEKMSLFIGLPADDRILQRITASVKPERAFAYRTNPDLLNYAQSISSRLASFGYKP